MVGESDGKGIREKGGCSVGIRGKGRVWWLSGGCDWGGGREDVVWGQRDGMMRIW